MDLSFYPLTLEALDQCQAESLCLFVGADERPLRGLAGLVDWRLAGGLSRYLRSGFVTGNADDALLTQPGPRLGFHKLFIFGLGALDDLAESDLSQRLAEGIRKVGRAGVQSAAFDLPARLPVELGVRALVFEQEGPPKALVFGPDPAQLVTALSHAAAQGPQAPVVERRVVKVEGPPRPVNPLQQRPLMSQPTLVKPTPEGAGHRSKKKRR